LPGKEKKKRKNYVGGETSPTTIKEKETLWSKVPHVYPHQVREGREALLENPTTGFHTTSAGAKNRQTHPHVQSREDRFTNPQTPSPDLLQHNSTDLEQETCH